MSGLTMVNILTIFAYSAAGGTISIHITGEEHIPDVRAIIRGNSTFISIDDVSERLNIIPKKAGDELIVLCRDILCVPVQLDNENDAFHDSGTLMLSVDLVADGEIDIFDLVMVGVNYGVSYEGASCS